MGRRGERRCVSRGGKEDEQQDAGRGKRQKQAPDPLSSDPLQPAGDGERSPARFCSFSAPVLLSFNRLRQFRVLQLQRVFLNPPVGILFHI